MQQLKRPVHNTLKAVPTTPPKPKFEFFQHVALEDSDRHGTIVGMEYISPIIALVEGIRPGWSYTIRPESGIGKQAEDVLGADFESFIVHEKILED